MRISQEEKKKWDMAAYSFRVPVRLMDIKGNILYMAPKIRPGADPVQTCDIVKEKLLQPLESEKRDKNYPILFSDKYNLQFAGFRCKNLSSAVLVIGPFAHVATLSNFLPQMIEYYQIQDQEEFKNFMLFRCEPYSAVRLRYILKLMYYMEWGKIYNDLCINIFGEPPEQYEFDTKLLDYTFEGREEQIFSLEISDINAVIDLAASGESDAAIRKLDMLFSLGNYDKPLSAGRKKLKLKQAKQMYYGAGALIYKKFLEKGMDVAVAEALWFQYTQKAEKTEDFYSLGLLYRSLIIDFADRYIVNKSKYSSDIRKAIAYIEKNLHYDLNAGIIAKEINLNPHYFSDLFKKETGLVLTDYIQRQKVEEAMEALKLTEKSILEISTFLNFSSQSYFSKVFKKHTGMSPRQYRKKYKENRSAMLSNFPTRYG